MDTQFWQISEKVFLISQRILTLIGNGIDNKLSFRQQPQTKLSALPDLKEKKSGTSDSPLSGTFIRHTEKQFIHTWIHVWWRKISDLVWNTRKWWESSDHIGRKRRYRDIFYKDYIPIVILSSTSSCSNPLECHHFYSFE